MKAKFIPSLAFAAAAVFAVSCVDKSYSSENLDMGMTILPGVSVPIEKPLMEDKTFNELLDLGTTTTLAGGITAVPTAPVAATLTSGVSADPITITFDKTGILSTPGIGAALSTPIVAFSVENGSGVLSGTVGDKPFSGAISSTTKRVYLHEKGETPIHEDGVEAVDILCEGISGLFSKEIPSSITVSNLTYTPSSSVAKNVNRVGANLSLSAFGLVPITFKAGGKFTYSMEIEVPSDLGIDEYVTKGNTYEATVGISTDINLALTPTLVEPRDITLTIKPATITKDSKEVTASVVFNTEPSNISKIKFSVVIENKSNAPVSISNSSKLSVDLKSLCLPDGIDFSI